MKNILWKIYDIYQKFSPINTSGILLYILKLNKQENIYDIKPLIEYLKAPLNEVFYSYRAKNIYNNKLVNEKIVYISSLSDIYYNDLSNNNNFLENLLIDFLIYNKAKIEDFKKYFKQDYLEEIECISKMYRGDEVKSDIYSKYFNNEEYENLVQRTEMSICEHNKKEFKVEEEVKIDIDFKNTKSINLSIYEIESENYYLTKKEPINSLINIEGIIASQTADIKIEGGENPLKLIRQTINISQIPNNKPRIYLVEILGKGISSRIIIKKGRLNLVTRNTPEGILCQIINEKNEVVKDDKTYLWYNDTKFNCEKEKGFILLPYKVLNSSNNKCILVHDSYADITEIKMRKENYELKGYFNYLNESIIPGNMLKVNFKPMLYSNGREVSLELIKKGSITVEMQKLENDEKLPVTTNFENISFKDDNKDYEFEVLIPPMMTEMKFNFSCEINNSLTGEKKSVSYNQDSNFYSCNSLQYIPLFHKVGKNYIYEIIGRNGENITNKAGKDEKVNIYTNYHLDSINVYLQYDEKGRLNLGELKNVEKIKIDGKEYILNENSKYCYPDRVDIISGESFTLPI